MKNIFIALIAVLLISSCSEDSSNTLNSDLDSDGIENTSDNCPEAANPNQEDADGDGIGDACDTDIDGDNISNEEDNCPFTPNEDQKDTNNDGIGDVCQDDLDGDGTNNDVDNCPETANETQNDLDSDGIGDVCDEDIDGDGISNEEDNCPSVANQNQEDLDGDGIGDACDDLILTFPFSFSTETYFDANTKNIEPSYNYNWVDPVNADVLDQQEFSPSKGNSYVRDPYMSRTLSDRHDHHQGLDITAFVSHNGTIYDEDNLPPIISMCDGIVDRIDEDNLCSIYVVCDEGFANPDMGENVEFIYRHLQSFTSDLSEGDRVNAGDELGIMGNCGANTHHLHLSCRRDDPRMNVKLARMFDPERGGILRETQIAEIKMMYSNEDSSLFRFAFPGNEWGVNEFFIQSGTDKRYINMEEITEVHDDDRDDPYIIQGLKIVSYPFNGEKSACDLYENDKDDLPVYYPGSTLRGEGKYYPIECEGLQETVAFVIDITWYGELSGTVSAGMLDVWGNGVKTEEISL